MQRGPFRHPVFVLLMMWFTCGLYFLYWYFKASSEINHGLGYQRLNIGVDFLLGVLTCGLWFLWWHWQAAEAVIEMEQSWGVEPKMDAPVLFLLSFFGVGEMMLQVSMNNAWENGTPPGEPKRLEGEAQGPYASPIDESTESQNQPVHQPPPGTDGW